ncbi:hypothetical protein [Agromyces silvae]|uniref:hypothetical protein n=1 Tax=Agromyces silvae TaxID=3388266 RepID=UPI00280C3571|nr:hypothetical protein [Agromyces protaetiae]
MSAPVEPATDASGQAAVTDASGQAAVATPFTMVTGDPAAMVCTDDVCFIRGTQPPA